MLKTLRMRVLASLALLLAVVGWGASEAFVAFSERQVQALVDRSEVELMQRVMLGFQQPITALVRMAVDYGVWDDSVEYLHKKSPKYLESNYTSFAMESNVTDFAIYLNAAGNLHSAVELNAHEVLMYVVPSPATTAAQTLWSSLTPQQQQSGGYAIRSMQEQPVLLAYSPIRQSGGKSKVFGAIVFGRYLNAANMASLTGLTGVRFRLMPENLAPLASRGPTGANLSVSLVSDSTGVSAYRLVAELPNSMKEVLLTSTRAIRWSAFAVLMVALLSVAWVTNRLILARLQRFSSLARSQHRFEPQYMPLWPVQGHDELDDLALALNDLMSKLFLAHDNLKIQAHTDALTKLGNRLLFFERLELLLALQRRQPGMTLAVLLLNLDDFKLVNDALGHSAGDEVLIEIANRLREDARESDTAVRFGGDEFALIAVLNGGEPGVRIFAERMLATINRPFTYLGADITLTCSVGICCAHGESSKDELVRNADIAKYAAKAEGKNRCVFFTDQMYQRVQERMTMEQALRLAVTNESLEAWFQPVVELSTGRVVALEALARWLREDGYCPPDQFIPIAEESDLIRALGLLIAKKSMAALVVIRQTHPQITVGVNLSVRQLRSRQTLTRLCELVDGQHLPRDSVHFEVTESDVARDFLLLEEHLNLYVQAGFSLHLDDFGTGQSSLHRLQGLPVSTLKIDKSFVDLIDSGDERFVKTILLLSEQLGLAVIAEGVETAHQRDRLQALGCQFIQGYFYARPMPLPDLLKFLTNQAEPALAQGSDPRS
jgi:diguanylate cyclase (GGDEF)-like protein